MKGNPTQRDVLGITTLHGVVVAGRSRIQHGDGSLPDHFEHVSIHNQGSVLINPDAKLVRVLGQGRQQSAASAALAKVLIDDDAMHELHARPDLHVVDSRRGLGQSLHDHHTGHHGGPGTGSGQDHAVFMTAMQYLIYLGASQKVGDSHLIAAGEENAGRFTDGLDQVFRCRLVSRADIERLDLFDPETLEQGDVFFSHLLWKLRRHGQNKEARFRTTR